MDWIDEFIELFMSQKTGSVEKALLYKQQYIPQKLYRYRSAEKIERLKDEIVNGRIFMSSPLNMNDPFDSCSLLENSKPTVYVHDKKIYEETFKEILDKNTFNKIFKDGNWFEKLTESVALKYVSPEVIDEAKEKALKTIMQGIEDINSEINETINRTYRFACFTQSKTNLPMWNHYANGHKGVCLEYDTTEINNIININALFPVKYVDKLPDGISLMKAQDELRMEYFLMHKLRDWSYENEWRLIYNIGFWYKDPSEVSYEIWKKGASIYFALPSKVYLGAKISDFDEEQIRKWCSEHRIPVQKMKCTEYGLKAT